MEDRFQFRVFYKPHKKIYNVICLNCLRQKEIIIEYKGSSAIVEWKNCIILQCTGMRDINDKIIYEADILKDVDGTYKIIYHKDLCQYVALSIEHNYCKDIIDLHSPEIIDNVYNKQD